MNKLILFSLLLLLPMTLLCMEDSAGAGGYKSQSTDSINPELFNSHNDYLSMMADDILIKILSKHEELDPVILSPVAKRFRNIVELILAEKWQSLKFQEQNKLIPQIIKSMNLPKDSLINYSNYIELYKYILTLTEEKTPTSKPKNITNHEHLFGITEKLADKNLMKLWPRLRNAIIRETPNTRSSIVTNVVSPEQIREWLNNQQNLPAIQALNDLNLIGLGLTILPEEISLFVNLKTLNLSLNLLETTNIPDTLVNLETLEIESNPLRTILIPNTLTNLKTLELHLNKLRILDIPDQLVKLEVVDASFNELKAINIPNTIRSLRELNLNNNKLTKINIASSLTNLESLYLASNELESIDIPNSLNKLKLLSLSNNKLLNMGIPEGLVNLEYLHINSNKLKTIRIPETLVNLKFINLIGNELLKLFIPNTLINLQTLWLIKNKLTPETTKIPAEIRAQAKISEDPVPYCACHSIPEEFEGAGGEHKN